MLLSVEVGSRACAIASDVIILLVTWFKIYPTKREADKHNISSPLATTLLRDGTVYFIALLSLNITILSTRIAQNLADAVILDTALSSTITSHFLLTLRELACERQDEIASCPVPQGQDAGRGDSIDTHLWLQALVANMGDNFDCALEPFPDDDMSWDNTEDEANARICEWLRNIRPATDSGSDGRPSVVLRSDDEARLPPSSRKYRHCTDHIGESPAHGSRTDGGPALVAYGKESRARHAQVEQAGAAV
ncbi:hypothetical protein OBBRIDRAFT_891047 [Obba rivulosa]|uniref:Uncharacterized protein n=1 Tax=Obba rivulosa TaxID=1052685 RepID=A0A8E2AK20_9APHY|nr:hypothetical protein OBBRIDRAFT_891047 [Obba rivulosa]